ncbi:hypothetical protein [Bacillus thuringiensis]|uniref:hypothetical protein n=1 Tax=Bacillus thuringiensis TaxID=1428 RepID=UPI0021D69404|nr:hypothetical protein [Bacillus thuringiensis]MCU7668468.1 hypothetical protein [Bacillus thuringiensis]
MKIKQGRLWTQIINQTFADFTVYELGGSCCTRYQKNDKVYIKEINKSVEGIENGYIKFLNEVQHMIKANEKFVGFYPQILQINEDSNMYSVELEYCYNGTTLADLMRNEIVDTKYFEYSFEYMLDILLERFFIRKKNIVPNSDYIKDNYIQRIIRRIEDIYKLDIENKYGFSNTLLAINKNGFFLNGEYYPPILNYIKYISKDDELMNRLNITFNTESHHDLIPSNILVKADTFNRINDFKLIDPRGEGETGEENRHFMYDLGKMLLGIDTLDIFRIFNGKLEKKLYKFNKNGKKAGIYTFDLRFLVDNPVLNKYIKSNDLFWKIINKHSSRKESILSCEKNIQLKLLFSQACMYHPDISCRIIFEKDEELALCMYLRGSMMMRNFMDYYYGIDPLRNKNNLSRITLWPSVDEKENV